MSRLVLLFLLFSVAFAWTHYIAVAGSLYWYYWWFDIVMHFWGGLLLGLGVHALCRLHIVPVQPTLLVVVLVILAATVGWEVFEWFAGLYDIETHTLDTAQDIFLGFSGGLLAHFILTRLYNKRI